MFTHSWASEASQIITRCSMAVLRGSFCGIKMTPGLACRRRYRGSASGRDAARPSQRRFLSRFFQGHRPRPVSPRIGEVETGSGSGACKEDAKVLAKDASRNEPRAQARIKNQVGHRRTSTPSGPLFRLQLLGCGWPDGRDLRRRDNPAAPGFRVHKRLWALMQNRRFADIITRTVVVHAGTG